MKIKDFDSAQLVAKEGVEELYIVTWGAHVYYADQNGITMRSPWTESQTSKSEYKKTAFAFAVLCGFKPKNVSAELPKNKAYFATAEQVEKVISHLPSLDKELQEQLKEIFE